MGIKKRIMTSGQKFVDKHRALLKKMMDSSKFGGVAGDPDAIDIPGQLAFIDNLKVTDIENQTFSFIAALGGVPAASDTITVTLNGTVLGVTPALPNDIETENHTIGGVAYTKGYFGRPAGGNGTVTGTEWAESTRRCLSAASTPVVAPVGENTLKVAVTQNNKVRASQTVKFTVAAATAAITENAGLVTADNVNKQLDTDLEAGGARVTGIVAGDKNAWALDTNKYQITVTKDGEDVLLAAKAGEGRSVSADEKTATVALSTANGTLAQTDLLKTALAGDYVVTFHLLNMKEQRHLSFTAAAQEITA